MKKIILSIITLSTVTLAQGQFTITNLDLLPLDSAVTIYTDTVPNPSLIMLGTAGIDKTWDFSSAKAQKSAITRALLPANTTYPQYSIISNYAWETIRGVDTVFSYMDNFTNNLSNKVNVFKDPLGISGINFKTVNEPVQIMYNYSLKLNNTYNTSLNDSSVQVIDLDISTLNGAGTLAVIIDSVRIILTTKMSYVVDAIGKLKTPQDSNLTVLRLKTYSQTKTHIEAKGKPGNFFFPTVFTPVPNNLLAQVNPNLRNDSILKTHGYEFWTNEGYLPLVKVISNEAGDTANVVDWQQHHASLRAIGLKALVNNVQVNMYPNPTSGFITITNNTLAKTAKVTDFTGREVAQLPINNNTFDVSMLKNGNYIVTLFNIANIAVANARIVVNK
ncbi:MAG: T9SS type A sorting domain-containing protein [Bacteroidia bacterium]|nr:T9SS type A sorting domain-containing protein [Bacteroidia bacterium]